MQRTEAAFSDRFEIVKGEVVPLLPTGDVHGVVELRLGVLLEQADDLGRGLALSGEVGVARQSTTQATAIITQPMPEPSPGDTTGQCSLRLRAP
ncbi:MAG TPA: hypothetical protein VGO93_22020 [Candidatus Xenobia bacterium]|jgi:hypothetical protein